jgi:hypothetical protein
VQKLVEAYVFVGLYALFHINDRRPRRYPTLEIPAEVDVCAKYEEMLAPALGILSGMHPASMVSNTLAGKHLDAVVAALVELVASPVYATLVVEKRQHYRKQLDALLEASSLLLKVT